MLETHYLFALRVAKVSYLVLDFYLKITLLHVERNRHKLLFKISVLRGEALDEDTYLVERVCVDAARKHHNHNHHLLLECVHRIDIPISDCQHRHDCPVQTICVLFVEPGIVESFNFYPRTSFHPCHGGLHSDCPEETAAEVSNDQDKNT